jgi:site-specific recombinase
MLPFSIADQTRTFLTERGHAPATVAEIAAILEALCTAPDLTYRLKAWVRFIDWVREGANVALEHDGALAAVAVARWKMLFDLFDSVPDARQPLRSAVTEVLVEAEGTNLFGSIGMPSGRGFIAEFSDRLISKVLPEPADEHELARLLGRLYRTGAHVERFARLPADIFDRITELLFADQGTDTWKALRSDFGDGFRLLAARVQAEGLLDNLRARSRPCSVADSPFYRLVRSSDAVLDAWLADGDLQYPASVWRADCAACREEMSEVARRLESEGVSVDIVYALEVIDRGLTRMDLMVAIMESPPGRARRSAVHQLLALLIAANHNDRSIRHLIASNLQLLQRKIVERSSKTGEHYIAWTKKEYWHIWAAAAGGGLLTVFTAAMKMSIVGRGLPPFVEGMAAGLNYAVSFLFLQAFGLILATKQPAMTAAALAAIMREHRGADRLDSIVGYAAQIVRSQLAAAMSNVAVVAIGAYAFSFIWQALLGHPFLDHHEAEHVFETLSPVDSGTVWYAALTGAILWAASLVGGWFDNWAAYHRLPRAISEHPIGERIGRQRMARLAGVVSRNISGWGTNISLGFMLGLTPVIGAFLGLPLDVRHVTLSTGTLSLAAAGAGQNLVFGGWFLWALGGIGTMFVLNLSVSFLLSLNTAARAFGLPRSFLVDFARAVARRFIRSPGSFLLPPRERDPP